MNRLAIWLRYLSRRLDWSVCSGFLATSGDLDRRKRPRMTMSAFILSRAIRVCSCCFVQSSGLFLANGNCDQPVLHGCEPALSIPYSYQLNSGTSHGAGYRAPQPILHRYIPNCAPAVARATAYDCRRSAGQQRRAVATSGKTVPADHHVRHLASAGSASRHAHHVLTMRSAQVGA